MPDPVVVQVLREFREALRLREAAQMAEMALRYAQIERVLTDKMELLAVDLAAKQAAGEVVTEGALYRMERYRELHAQALLELERYSGQYALPLIEAEQAYYGEMGIRSAQMAMMAQLEAGGINIAWNRLPVEAIQNMIGMAGDGSPLARLLAKSYPAAMDGMIQQLIASTALGINPRQTARNMVNGFGMGLDRVLVLARTEQLRAFRTASTAQYRESGIVKGFRRLVTQDTRTCLACLASDGEWFDVAAELTDHPCGRCAAVAVLAVGPEVQWEKAQDWFAGLDDATQGRMLGNKYDAWKQGDISFSDLRRTAHSDTWGDSPRVATLAELGIGA